jgi:DnaJ-class molecular chaperone
MLLVFFDAPVYSQTIAMADSVQACFGEMGAYEILGIEKTATKDQIKRAYFKKALLYVCGLP